MSYLIDGKEVEVTFHKAQYPNDMMNGILGDMPEQYIFLSDHVQQHRDFVQAIDDTDVNYYDLTDCDIDWSAAPHSWVLDSLAKLVVRTAEGLLD